MLLSPDHFIYNADGEYEYTPERCNQAWEMMYLQLEAAIQDRRYQRLVLMVGLPGAGKSTWLSHNQDPYTIYVDATFTLRCHRVYLIKKASIRPDLVVEAVFMDTPIHECLRRNDTRSPDRKVPEARIGQMGQQLLAEPPDIREGFFQVIRVTP